MAFQQHLESLRRYNPTTEFEYSSDTSAACSVPTRRISNDETKQLEEQVCPLSLLYYGGDRCACTNLHHLGKFQWSERRSNLRTTPAGLRRRLLWHDSDWRGQFGLRTRQRMRHS